MIFLQKSILILQKYHVNIAKITLYLTLQKCNIFIKGGKRNEYR